MTSLLYIFSLSLSLFCRKQVYQKLSDNYLVFFSVFRTRGKECFIMCVANMNGVTQPKCYAVNMIK